MAKKIFSIVIPTLNEEKYLPRLLEDLSKQSMPKELFEIVHVDGHSEDTTVMRANKFSSKLNIKSIVVGKRNVSFQRNAGAVESNGKWVIFMDADNRLPTYFLDGIKYQLAKNKNVDIFTTWSTSGGSKAGSIESSVHRFFNLGLELFKATGKSAAFGAMIGVKKSWCKKIKFQENQKFMEDTFFVNDVVNAGGVFKIFEEPRYVYSLRRLRKEGLLKNLSNTAVLQLKFLSGKDFTTDSRYIMEGGSYYDKISPSLIKNIVSNARKMPSQQLKTARNILNKINQELGVN